jgi:hypothetical protein
MAKPKKTTKPDDVLLEEMGEEELAAYHVAEEARILAEGKCKKEADEEDDDEDDDDLDKPDEEDDDEDDLKEGNEKAQKAHDAHMSSTRELTKAGAAAAGKKSGPEVEALHAAFKKWSETKKGLEESTDSGLDTLDESDQKVVAKKTYKILLKGKTVKAKVLKVWQPFGGGIRTKPSELFVSYTINGGEPARMSLEGFTKALVVSEGTEVDANGNIKSTGNGKTFTTSAAAPAKTIKSLTPGKNYTVKWFNVMHNRDEPMQLTVIRDYRKTPGGETWATFKLGKETKTRDLPVSKLIRALIQQ